MSERIDRAATVAVEPELRAKLERLDAGGRENADGEGGAMPPEARAREMLARIAWSRLVEPGDAVAGVLLQTLGAVRALELLVGRVSPSKLRAEAATAGLTLGREAAHALKRWYPRLSRAETVGDIERALDVGLGVVLPGDPLWPPRLADLGEHQPTLLWVRGDPAKLGEPALSVVGARAVTGYGTHITAEIVEGVCAAGLSIVSGAAYGVDAVAHRTALAIEAPTVAVLAGGADRAYPAAHDTLLERIAAGGAVCSEMIPGAAPTRWRFLQRNRIIAALSGATLVTEAGVRSGTINTAGHAASLGRALGAVPGPVTSAASAGCHRLIREYGATLVTNAREACELLGFDTGFGLSENDGPAEARESSLHRRVLDALPLRGGRATEEVARLAGLDLEQAQGALAELELLGHVRRRDSPPGAALQWALLRRE